MAHSKFMQRNYLKNARWDKNVRFSIKQNKYLDIRNHQTIASQFNEMGNLQNNL